MKKKTKKEKVVLKFKNGSSIALNPSEESELDKTMMF